MVYAVTLAEADELVDDTLTLCAAIWSGATLDKLSA